MPLGREGSRTGRPSGKALDPEGRSEDEAHFSTVPCWGFILLHQQLDAVTLKGSVNLGEVVLFSWAIRKGLTALDISSSWGHSPLFQTHSSSQGEVVAGLSHMVEIQ